MSKQNENFDNSSESEVLNDKDLESVDGGILAERNPVPLKFKFEGGAKGDELKIS